MTLASSSLIPRESWRGFITRVFTVIVTIAVGSAVGNPAAVAQSEQIRLAEQAATNEQARTFALDMLGTTFPASKNAAEAALRGGDRELTAYASGGMDEAKRQDLAQILVIISGLSGQKVQEEAAKALSSNDPVVMADFMENGWQSAQVVDDRAVAWEASQAPDGSSLKAAADAALQENTPDALSEFAATGADIARAHDRRREVYELTNSPFPAVAAGASEAIQVGTDTAIESYLRYGQFVDAAQDMETMDITNLVDIATAQSAKAEESASLAAQDADQARRATELSRQATQLAKDEAMSADGAQVRAGNAAAAAGQLATQSAAAADNAVAAAAEAKQALAQTADALSRAASAAATARMAANEAASRASAAGVDASMTYQAGVAAERARDAAAAAEDAANSFAHADAAAGYARSAGGAAASAAGNADAAAAAAEQAAAAAGAGDQAAAEARAGAARARAAANRARASANEVDGLVAQISSLVEQARTAAREAAEHARRSAQAAEDAARFAGDAAESARRAGVNAQDAQDAAVKSIDAMNLAAQTAEVARTAADQRLTQEAEFLKDQARQARDIQDARDAISTQQQAKRQALEDDLVKLADVAANPESSSIDAAEVKQLAVSAVQVGSPAVAGGAKVALQTGNDADLKAFVSQYENLAYQDDLGQLYHVWQTDPSEEVRNRADLLVEQSPAEIHRFLTEELPELHKPDLIQRTWQLRDQGGTGVQTAADNALRTNTYDALHEFVYGGGFDKARYEDQLRLAYDLASTGTPEVKAAAEAAVLGDREGLDEFVSIEMYRCGAADAQRATHDEHINALLQRGFAAAQRAAESASKAQQSYYAAQGDAVRAANYAQEAASWAGRAQESATQAAGHVQSAEASLTFALEQQQRAHAAATQAEADAAQASANADQAASYAAAAHQSANEAASSAASARASAVSAGQDAELASQAATEAYDIAMQMELRERAEAQEAAAAGISENPQESVMESIREIIGKEALNLILDLIGVTDVVNCFKGDISGCLWTALNFLPVGKFIKMGKAIPAVKKLIGKLPDIKRVMGAKSAARAQRVEHSLTATAACVVAGSHMAPTFRTARYEKTSVRGPVFVPAASRCEGYPRVFTALRLDLNTLTPDEMNVYMRWNKKKPLAELTSNDLAQRELRGYPLPLEIDPVIDSLKRKVRTEEIRVDGPHRLNDSAAKGLKETSSPDPLPLDTRNVSRDEMQNKLAQADALISKRVHGAEVRLNQRDTYFRQVDDGMGKMVFEEVTTSRGRPDLNLWFTKEGRGISTKIEYDLPSSPRGIGHAMAAFDANPEAQVLLLTAGGPGTLSGDVRKVIEANLEAVKQLG